MAQHEAYQMFAYLTMEDIDKSVQKILNKQSPPEDDLLLDQIITNKKQPDLSPASGQLLLVVRAPPGSTIENIQSAGDENK